MEEQEVDIRHARPQPAGGSQHARPFLFLPPFDAAASAHRPVRQYTYCLAVSLFLALRRIRLSRICRPAQATCCVPLTARVSVGKPYLTETKKILSHQVELSVPSRGGVPRPLSLSLPPSRSPALTYLSFYSFFLTCHLRYGLTDGHQVTAHSVWDGP